MNAWSDVAVDPDDQFASQLDVLVAALHAQTDPDPHRSRPNRET